MKKHTINRFGRHYYLGADASGEKYYLEAASWDCGWYYGFGYVHTFTNNSYPQRANDIDSHTHFNTLFFGGQECAFDTFKKLLPNTPLTDKEIWELLELMQSFYIARTYSDFIYLGGAHFTANPCKDAIMNLSEYDRINQVILPTIFENIYALLEG